MQGMIHPRPLEASGFTRPIACARVRGRRRLVPCRKFDVKQLGGRARGVARSATGGELRHVPQQPTTGPRRLATPQVSHTFVTVMSVQFARLSTISATVALCRVRYEAGELRKPLHTNRFVSSGVVAEWFKAAVLKTAKGESPSRVRISPTPLPDQPHSARPCGLRDRHGGRGATGLFLTPPRCKGFRLVKRITS
jgi:hypothetical protein